MKGLATPAGASYKMTLHQHFTGKHKDALSLTQATITDGARLDQLFTALGFPKILFLVSEIIRRFCSQFNVAKNMTPYQIEDYAAEFILEQKSRKNQIRLEELAVFFDRAAKGEFFGSGAARVFDRIDRGVLDAMLDIYFEGHDGKGGDRTRAVWALEQAKEQARRDSEAEANTARLEGIQGKDGTPVLFKDIYDHAGTGKISTLKALNEMHQRWGGAAE